MPTTTKPEALITTPADNAKCPDHGDTGIRYEGETSPTFAHCKVCGRTDLLDDRSPFESPYEAIANAAAPDLAVETRWGRQDVVERVRPFAAAMSRNHCADCRTWSARVPVRD